VLSGSTDILVCALPGILVGGTDIPVCALSRASGHDTFRRAVHSGFVTLSEHSRPKNLLARPALCGSHPVGDPWVTVVVVMFGAMISVTEHGLGPETYALTRFL
jgi:hypothetical protein